MEAHFFSNNRLGVIVSDWKESLTSIGKGALIASLGAALTYALEAAQGGSFGIYTPLVVAGLSIAVNALRKLATPAT